MEQTAFHSSQLSKKLLCSAFPFHLAVDKGGSIISHGDAILKKIRTKLAVTDSLFEHFFFQHPGGVETMSHLSVLSDNKLLLLQSKDDDKLVLRGQLVINEEAGVYIFLVAPWVTEVENLDAMGLLLSDFPVHSPTSDFLLLVQAQRASLEESARLSDELTKLNKELEARVSRRTQALEEKAEQVQRSKNSLEKEMRERERVEVELRHAQKLEAVGQLAAGIAHEINTPMQYIGSSLEFLQSALTNLGTLHRRSVDCLTNDLFLHNSDAQDLLKYSEDIDLEYVCARGPKAISRALEGIERVTNIVQAMNEFTHPDNTEMEQADINRAIETVLIVARSEYKHIADIETDFDPLPNISCYLGSLNQVFLNLIVNSAHAIGEKNQGNGLITIATRICNNAIIVSITDNGIGIAPEIQHRIYDPFFTTKPVGKGTGQGLSISHNIVVDKHHGKFTFQTVQNQGTTFTIKLPIFNQNNDSAPQLSTGTGEQAA